MVLFNATDILGLSIISATNNITGSLYITLFGLLIILFVFFLMLRIPLELVIALIIPIILTFMAYMGGDWVIIGGIAFIYVTFIFIRLWIR
jgi:hypothetical protein